MEDRAVNIIFHNPNTPEDCARLLIKLAAQNMLDYMCRLEKNREEEVG